MTNAMTQELRKRLRHISRGWIDRGLPTRQRLEQTVLELTDWKVQNQVQGIWAQSPRMISATLDDGMGYGLALIEQYAAIMGISVNHLGLLQKPEKIIAACNQEKPDFVGLTVLQLDSDDDLAKVGLNLPPGTCLIAGGPVFQYDPDMATRCAVDHVAKNVAHFIDYLLDWTLDNGPAR